MTKYNYQFLDGFKVVEEGEAEMLQIRIRGIELAIKYNTKITDRVNDPRTSKWLDLGTSMPDETYHMFGDVYRLDKDGRNFWLATENREWYDFNNTEL